MDSIERIVKIKYYKWTIRFKIQEKGAVMVNGEDIGNVLSCNVDKFLNSPIAKKYKDALKKSNSILSDMSLKENRYFKNEDNETYLCSFLALKFIELKSFDFHFWLDDKIQDLMYERAKAFHYEESVINLELEKNGIIYNTIFPKPTQNGFDA